MEMKLTRREAFIGGCAFFVGLLMGIALAYNVDIYTLLAASVLIAFIIPLLAYEVYPDAKS